MTRKRNVSETATGSALPPARAKKASTTTHSRRTKAAASLAETPAAKTMNATPETEPAHEQIARLAYSYWVARGQQGGSPEEDWARAEQELRGRA